MQSSAARPQPAEDPGQNQASLPHYLAAQVARKGRSDPHGIPEATCAAVATSVRSSGLIR